MKRVVLCLYCAFILLFVLFSYVFIDPNLTPLKSFYTGIAFEKRFITTLAYGLFILSFFLFYVYFLALAAKKNLSKRYLYITLVSSLFLILAYPATFSYDIFNYLATAKVTYYYLENPYLVMPIEFEGDPVLLYTRAANKYALYGPVWILFSGVPYLLSLGSFFVQILAFKTLAAVFLAGLSYIIYKLSKNLTATLFFALNPLVLVETLVSGHNDVVMMFFALSAFYLIKEKRVIASSFLIAVSILIKFATVFIFPVWLYTVVLSFKKKTINWENVWVYSVVFMTVIFILSPLREEMYPWYFIWILPFIALIEKRIALKLYAVAFSLGLMLSYIPYMYLGTYFSPTPYIRFGLIILPLLLTFLFTQVFNMIINKK